MKRVRLLMASVIGLCLLPVISAVTAGTIASLNNCKMHEGRPHPCMVASVDIGGELYGWGYMGWFAVITLPLAGLTLVAWCVAEIVNAVKKGKANAKLKN
jgi:hypothetical protein